MKEIVIASAVRTAVGTFGGSLKNITPMDLGATVIKNALEQAKVDSCFVLMKYYLDQYYKRVTDKGLQDNQL